MGNKQSQSMPTINYTNIDNNGEYGKWQHLGEISDTFITSSSLVNLNDYQFLIIPQMIYLEKKQPIGIYKYDSITNKLQLFIPYPSKYDYHIRRVQATFDQTNRTLYIFSGDSNILVKCIINEAHPLKSKFHFIKFKK